MERKVNSKLFYKNNKPLLFKLPNEPQKNFFKLKILEGGGVITDNDNADVIISSQTITSNVPNVYSKDFIIDSYFFNKLQDLNKYTIKIQNSTKEDKINIPITLKPKKVRVEYTKEDDNILASFIKDCTCPKGKIVYKELEEKFPQHSWQSWRERYIKVVGPAMESGNWPTYKFESNNNENDKVTHQNINNDNNNCGDKNTSNRNLGVSHKKKSLNFIQSNVMKNNSTPKENVNNDTESNDNNNDNDDRSNEINDNNNANKNNDDNVEENHSNSHNNKKDNDNNTNNDIGTKKNNKRTNKLKNDKHSKKDRKKLFYNTMDSDDNNSDDNVIPSIIQERRLYTKTIRTSNKSKKKGKSNNPKKQKSAIDKNSSIDIYLIRNKKKEENQNTQDKHDSANNDLEKEEEEKEEENDEDKRKNITKNEKNEKIKDRINSKGKEENNENGEKDYSEEIIHKDYEQDMMNNKIINKEKKVLERNSTNNDINSDSIVNLMESKTVNNEEKNSTSSDEDSDLQSYINGYFNEKNIQKYGINKSKKNSNSENKENSKSRVESVNNKNKINDDSNRPISLSSKFLKKNNSKVTAKDRNKSVNNLKNLIKKINNSQHLSQPLLNKNENDENKDKNEIDSITKMNIDNTTNNDNTDSDPENDEYAQIDGRNIYFSYPDFFNNPDMDIPLSNNSIEYDNYLSRTIENSKNAVNLPNVSKRHKELYIQQCLKLCSENHKTKKELCELLHQCNGSLPAAKALLKTKHQSSKEILNPKLREWVWTKVEDDILLKSKDESQLKKIRLKKSNKSVRYRELYLEAKEIYNKINNNDSYYIH